MTKPTTSVSASLVQHEALDAATQGFKDALTEELGDKVTFDEQNAQGDSNTCSTIINRLCFRQCRPDPCKCNTCTSGSYRPEPHDIPILGTSVTEYGVALGH